MYKNNSTWINGLVQGANNTVTQIFHTGYEAVATLANFIRHLIPDSVQNDASLLEAQNKYKALLERIDIEREKLRLQARTSVELIKLKKRELELRERELELKQWFYHQKLSLIQKHHEENVQLKLQEFQNNWDVNRSFFSLSREDTQKLFQRSDKFWILLSPPKIETSIPEFESLCTKVEYSISQTVNSHYLTASDSYPIGFRQIFDRPIKAFEAVHTREFLAPVPTLILGSVITEREVYMTLTFPNPIDSYNGSNDKQISLPSWNWEEMKVSLESTGKNSQESIHYVKELIAIIHTVLAVYFCDIYCLSIDPYHEPKLFDFLQNSGFPETFQQWVEPYQTSLRELQKSLIRKLSPSPNPTYNFGYILAFLLVIAIIPLLGMCNSISSHNSPEVAAVNKSKKIAKKFRKSGVSGVIKANYSGYNAVVLRALPSAKAKEVSKLLNDNYVTLWEFNDDNQWRKVTTKDGLSGWVWAKSVREKKVSIASCIT